MVGRDEDGDEVELQPKKAGGISVVTQFDTTYTEKDSLEEV